MPDQDKEPARYNPFARVADILRAKAGDPVPAPAEKAKPLVPAAPVEPRVDADTMSMLLDLFDPRPLYRRLASGAGDLFGKMSDVNEPPRAPYAGRDIQLPAQGKSIQSLNDAMNRRRAGQ